MKKAQAALEFIFSYGWAILAVIVSLVGLAYFGILDISRFMPGKCFLESGLACTEYKIESQSGPSQVQLMIQNSMGQVIDNVIVYIGEPCGANSGAGVSMGNTLIHQFDIDCGSTLSERNFKSDLNVSYSLEGSSITRVNGGEISTRVE